MSRAVYHNNFLLIMSLKIFKPFLLPGKLICLFIFIFFLRATVIAQASIPLTDLSFFKQASASWRVAGDVKADLNTANVLQASTGTGVLVNTPGEKTPGADLYSNMEHGDADLELDYLMAKGSNSGIYLQGRYEVQLLDSWGVLNAKAGDNGGVYERWDESRPQGQKGYEGYAPRQNVSKAPGLWQHLRISFQAPRFENGKKTENAKMLRIELNGVLIHENVEMFGATRGGMEPEAAKGPLRLQGDHGAVAFRNIKLTSYDKPRPELVNLRYSVYKGLFENEPDYKKLPPEAEGTSVVLSSNLNNLPDSFMLRYTGILKVKEPGEYAFNLSTAAGRGTLKINNQLVPAATRRSGPVKVSLPAGDLPFEMIYSKFQDWSKPALGLAVSGPGIREYIISDANNLSGEQVDPILVDAPANTVLRSFMDVPGGRVVHAISVGNPGGVHYTYDMDNGTVVQSWRGGFLDATPMWHERGDGSSRPIGSVILFGKPVMNMARLSSVNGAWIKDTTGTSYRPKGYTLDQQDRPVFHYFIYSARVDDAIQVLENRGGLSREINVQNAPADLYMRLAEANTIEDLGGGSYLLNDKSYYLKIDDAGGTKPFIRDGNNKKELLVPVKTKIKYTVLF